jgi:hypothetical protein
VGSASRQYQSSCLLLKIQSFGDRVALSGPDVYVSFEDEDRFKSPKRCVLSKRQDYG